MSRALVSKSSLAAEHTFRLIIDRGILVVVAELVLKETCHESLALLDEVIVETGLIEYTNMLQFHVDTNQRYVLWGRTCEVDFS